MFYYHFQEICGLTSSMLPRFEALLRCSSSNKFCNKILQKISLEDQISKVLSSVVGMDLFVHFNISPGIKRSDLDTIKSVCESLSWPEKRLVLEVVESGIIDLDILFYARNLGFSLALDDLGNGSSLYNIQQDFYYDYIKFDKAWLISSVHRSILISVIEKLRYLYPLSEFILEGVEDKNCYSFAKTLNVQYLQGFYLHKPAKLFMNNKVA